MEEPTQPHSTSLDIETSREIVSYLEKLSRNGSCNYLAISNSLAIFVRAVDPAGKIACLLDIEDSPGVFKLVSPRLAEIENNRARRETGNKIVSERAQAAEKAFNLLVNKGIAKSQASQIVERCLAGGMKDSIAEKLGLSKYVVKIEAHL